LSPTAKVAIIESNSQQKHIGSVEKASTHTPVPILQRFEELISENEQLRIENTVLKQEKMRLLEELLSIRDKLPQKKRAPCVTLNFGEYLWEEYFSH
jgi:regulator of replication initiation timing